MISYYLLTITHVRVKESPSVQDLDTVFKNVQEIIGCDVQEHCKERGPKYNHLHLHAIVTLTRGTKYITKYVLDNRTYQVRWDKFRKTDYYKVKSYIYKSLHLNRDPDIEYDPCAGKIVYCG